MKTISNLIRPSGDSRHPGPCADETHFSPRLRPSQLLKLMNAKSKFNTVAKLLAMILLLGASTANAALSVLNPWAQQYAGNSYPSGAVNASYAIANGNNRLLVVAVAATRTSAGTLTCSATYGGVAMTLAAGDGTSSATWNHTFIFYLKDADIGSAAGGKSLNVTVSGGTAYYGY
ncbi:MAG TPA: hypothetical protein PKA41_11410, partial [Verrucomicrobiota bacterium]|nr:hypothetical protein [Verrucomicrobiota bacterium]